MANEYREIEVYIGPFEEWKGKVLNKAQSIHLVSNGNNNTLRIAVSVHRAILSFCTCQLNIWNLSEGTRDSLKKEMSVYVFAGFEGRDDKEMVFFGGIRNVNSTRQGPDVITTIDCLTSNGAYMRASISKTYTEGVKVKEIVKEMASTLEGVIVDPTEIDVEGELGPSGFSCCASTMDALNNLGGQFGFSWTVDNGIFKAKTDGKFNNVQRVLNATNGLRKVSPRLFGPWAVQRGADIEAQYLPNFNLRDKVKAESELNKNLTNVYGINEINYNLCPKDNSWDMHIVSLMQLGTEAENG